MNTASDLAPASCLNAKIPATALLALCVLASAAVAAPAPDTTPVTRSTNVSLAGLDLSTPEGVGLARDRLRGAARRLCGQVADDLDLSHHTNYVACVDKTLAAALRKLTETGASTSTAAKVAQTAARSATDAHEVSPCAVSQSN
jgi:UrcA family protein